MNEFPLRFHAETPLVQLRTFCGWTSPLSAGAAEKPYTVEEAVSYNELDYLSVSPLNSKELH